MRSLRCGGSTELISLKFPCNVGSALTCRPYQEETSVPPLVKLGHHAVDNVWFGRNDVYRVHVSYGLPPVFDALDVYGEVRGTSLEL